MKAYLKYFIYLIIVISIFIFPNCRTMMINQTAETLKPKQMESTAFNGLGYAAKIVGNTHSLKAQIGFQQRFGLSENIEFQLFLFSDLDILTGMYPFMYLSNDISLNPKFRLFHTNNFDLALLPKVGIYNVLYELNILDYLGPYAGLTLVVSNKLKNNNISIYYGLGFQVGENFLKQNFWDSKFNNRLNDLLVDISLSSSFGTEIVRNNFVTRHELSFTTSFDCERNINEVYTYLGYLDNIYISINYEFSIGGRYSIKGKNK